MASERVSEQLVERARRVQRKTEEAAKAPDSKQHPVLALQRQVGNAAVEGLLRKEATPGVVDVQRQEEEEEMLQPSHDSSIQREAEEEEMMASHDSSIQREGEEEEMMASHDASLQREGEEEEMMASHDGSLQRQEEEEEMMQASHDGGLAQAEVGLDGGGVSSTFEQTLASTRGSGSPVDSAVKERMESATGSDLSDVRVHRDADSDSMSRNITASAFTTGNDVYLRKDQNPSDSSLMSHELTHVVQQRTMAGSGGGVQVGAAGDAHEQEADDVSKYVNTHSPENDQEAEG
jgi:hypothetical protein